MTRSSAHTPREEVPNGVIPHGNSTRASVQSSRSNIVAPQIPAHFTIRGAAHELASGANARRGNRELGMYKCVVVVQLQTV